MKIPQAERLPEAPCVGRARRTAQAAGPVLFGSQGSRSPLVNWYLYEIGRDQRRRKHKKKRYISSFGSAN